MKKRNHIVTVMQYYLSKVFTSKEGYWKVQEKKSKNEEYLGDNFPYPFFHGIK